MEIAISEPIKKNDWNRFTFRSGYDFYFITIDVLTNEFTNNKLCGLLTKAEKLWILEETNKWLKSD